MGNIFKYFGMALEIATVVEGMIALFNAPGSAVTGAQIKIVVEPGIQAIKSVWSKVNIPDALVGDICNATADAIDAYYHQAPPKA